MMHKTKMIILSIVLSVLLIGCQTSTVSLAEIPRPQTTSAYITRPFDETPLLSPSQQKKAVQHFLTEYFKPWHHPDLVFIRSHALMTQQKELTRLATKPQWGSNFRVHDKQWVRRLESNMNLAHYPNRNQRAIIVENTALRVLPTEEPAFNDYLQAGEGYPFDNLQTSALWVGTPLYVLHQSKDGWSLVVTPHVFGWVRSHAIAYVSPQFVQQWENGHYVTLIQNHLPVRDNQGRFRFDGRLGTLLPKSGNHILIPVSNSEQQAEIKTALLHSSQYADFPWVLNRVHMSLLIQQLLGEPYGWGGLYAYRDCSLTMLDLFTVFGIRLPRNSLAQLQSRPFQNLGKMSVAEKEKWLIKHGKPFLTLLGVQGHVVLYVGTKNGKPMIFQDVWGVRKKNWLGRASRAVVGQVVLTPFDYGKQAFNLDKSFIEMVQYATYLDQEV